MCVCMRVGAAKLIGRRRSRRYYSFERIDSQRKVYRLKRFRIGFSKIRCKNFFVSSVRMLLTLALLILYELLGEKKKIGFYALRKPLVIRHVTDESRL